MKSNTIRRHRIQWLKALLSGKFKQGTGKLKQPNSHLVSKGHINKAVKFYYCCLGVACELSKTGIWIGLNRHPQTYLIESGTPRESEDFMPPKARGWLGISEDFQYKLSKMNDSEGKTFKDIATFCANKWKINLNRITKKGK